MFCFSPFRRYKKEYSRLIKKRSRLITSEDTQPIFGDELDLLDTQIKALVEGEYAEEVFRFYNRKQPTLVRIHTGEEVSWKEAFGDSFESVSASARHSLVGLVEGGGKYRIK